jgi:hypothetical protein
LTQDSGGGTPEGHQDDAGHKERDKDSAGNEKATADDGDVWILVKRYTGELDHGYLLYVSLIEMCYR